MSQQEVLPPASMTPSTMAPVGVHTLQSVGGDPLMAMSASSAKARVQAVQSVMASIMKEEVHYGIVPGAKKPSLYKPGAEVLCMTFSLSARISTRITGDHPDIAYHWKDRKKEWYDGPRGKGFEWIDEEGDTYGFFEVVAVCDIYSPDGRLLASCEGSCNNREKKYRTLNVYEVRNTVMKMAGKRAYVAAVLMATGASDMFTQDLEDMEEEGGNGSSSGSGSESRGGAQKDTKSGDGWISPNQSKLLFVKGKKLGYSEDVVKHVQATLNGLGKAKGKPVFDAIADEKPDAVDRVWEKAKKALEGKKADSKPEASVDNPTGSEPEGNSEQAE